MNIVILYNPSVCNQYLVSELAVLYPDLQLIEEDQTYLEKVALALKRRRVSPWKKIDMLILGVFYVLFLRWIVDRRLCARLRNPRLTKPHLRVASVNSPEVREVVLQRRPDLVLVLGTRILEQQWLELGIPIVNLHWGVMPKYRGRFCWFWPVVHDDTQNLGITTHFVTSRVDAGSIIVQKRLGALEDYSIVSVLHAVARSSLSVLEQTIKIVARGMQIRPQSIAESCPQAAYLEPGMSDYLRYLQNQRSISASEKFR